MASRTIKPDDAARWGATASVAIYRESQCKIFEGLAPIGTPVATVTSGSDSAAAFTGLPDGEPCAAYSFAGGKHRYVRMVP